jgi:hypothetical protein
LIQTRSFRQTVTARASLGRADDPVGIKPASTAAVAKTILAATGDTFIGANITNVLAIEHVATNSVSEARGTLNTTLAEAVAASVAANTVYTMSRGTLSALRADFAIEQ